MDLFCGSGAVSEALRRHGYRVLVALDNDPVACRTYKLNHYRTRLICDDITRVDPNKHPKFRGIKAVDLVVACAPCQPFSSQNRHRKDDSRAALLLQSVKFVARLQPEILLFENVSGLASPENQYLLDKLRTELNGVGYLLGNPRRIDAADLGVPQRRVRCVMIAAKSNRALTMFEAADLPGSTTSVREAIGHLPPLRSGQRSDGDPLHFARKHQQLVLQRLRHIPPDGGSRADLPAHLELECHRNRPKGSFSDVYGRMRWDGVASTLTTGCSDLTRGRFVHPEQDRAITLREAALLQTFPHEYRFHGNSGQIARQIGNAVPVRMVEAMIPALEVILRSES